MARDYKHRAQSNNKTAGNPYGRPRPQDNAKVGALKWMLITALVIAFAVFLLYLRGMGAKQLPDSQMSQTAAANHLAKMEAAKKQAEEARKKAEAEAEAEAKKQPQPPQFDFYTILPKKEMVVADHEIKTRVREERVGKAKESHYVIQAGSFKTSLEADRLRAKLALMGIESKVSKAKVGDVVWYRVKIGPYARPESVKILMARLQQNDMKPVVTELESLD